MISPGFFSFFNAQRGLMTAQTGLNVINQNVANANTPGYSRQRVDIETMFPYSSPAPDSYEMRFLQMGQGSMVQSITRTRNAFLDNQFRIENSTLGMAEIASQLLGQAEGVMAEPAGSGLNTIMQQFFESAQQLSIYPDNPALRSDFVQHAISLVDIAQQQARQLNDLRVNVLGDYNQPTTIPVSELGINITQINQMLSDITRINQEINIVTASGAQPNDLLDKRDLLMDELSKKIDFVKEDLPGNLVRITIAGQEMVRGVQQHRQLEVSANVGDDGQPTMIRAIAIPGGPAHPPSAMLNDTITGGEVRGLLNVGEYTTTKVNLRGMILDLNALLDGIATAVNGLQATGRDQDGNLGAPNPIFQIVGAPALPIFGYRVNPNIIANARLVAAAEDDPLATGPPAGFAGEGDGRNALAFAQLRQSTTVPGMGGITVDDYFNASASRLGIDTQANDRRAVNQLALTNELDNKRQSFMGVNVDEEMVNMLRFQRAFESSSKMIQVFDEVLQSILNMT